MKSIDQHTTHLTHAGTNDTLSVEFRRMGVVEVSYPLGARAKLGLVMSFVGQSEQ